MISAVIQDDEESVGPLADGEVARLLSALHNAEFTRSDKHDFAKNSSFRQRSLIEIAAEAQKRKDAIETDQQNIGADVDGDSSDIENLPDAQRDSQSIKSLEAVKTNETASEKIIRDITSREKMDDEAPEPEVGVRGLTTNAPSISETDGTEQGIRGLTTKSTSISETDDTVPEIRGLTTKSISTSETDDTVPEIRGLTSVSHEEIDGLEKAQALGELASGQNGLVEQTAKDSFETVSEAFERGKTEGISEGRLAAIAETKEMAMADAKAELADIVDTFNKVLGSLARPKAMQVEALSSSINATILKLASERAGMQIDELPEAFSNRINALVTGVGQELAEAKVHLNEDDYATMKPYLTNLGFQVVANANLMRGDVTIEFDGVEVHDVAANRMASYSAVKSENAADDNTAATDSTAAGDNTAATDSIATGDNTAATDSTAADDNTAVTDSTAAGDNTAATDTTAATDNTTADDNVGIEKMLTGDESLPPSDEPGS